MPLALFFYASYVKETRGPYYYNFNDDPEYAYLLNSLNIAQGLAPHHVDHPGTPLQATGALILRGTHLLVPPSNGQPLVQSVISNPEYYLGAIQFTLLVTGCVTIGILGLTAYRYRQSIALAMLLQSSPFWFFTIGISMARVHAESMLLIIGYSISALLFSVITTTEASKPTNTRITVALGILTAIGVMTKVTFAPIAIALLLLTCGIRAKLIYVMSTLITSALWAIPLIPRLDYYTDWLVGLALHTEAYGKGEVGLIKLENLLFINRCMTDEPIYFISMIGILAYLCIQCAQWLRSKPATRSLQQIIQSPPVILSLFQIAFLIILFKQPRIHYLTPALPILAFTGVYFADSIKAYFKTTSRLFTLLAVALIGLFSILLGVRYESGIQAITAICTNSEAAEEFANSLPPTFTTANAYGSSNQNFALIFGDIFAGSHYEKEITTVYGKNLWFSVWASRFYLERTRIPIGELHPRTKGVIVRGSNMHPPSDGPVQPDQTAKFTLLKRFGNESFWIHEFAADVNTAQEPVH